MLFCSSLTADGSVIPAATVSAAATFAVSRACHAPPPKLPTHAISPTAMKADASARNKICLADI
jgi:hypothetical protein